MNLQLDIRNRQIDADDDVITSSYVVESQWYTGSGIMDWRSWTIPSVLIVHAGILQHWAFAAAIAAKQKASA